MSHNRPWFKFNARDWRADAALRGCSLAARGLWIEMLTLMHEAKPYGHLLVQGKPVSDSKLAVMCGIDLDLMGTLIGELEEAGVFSRREEDGVIFSRRMVRDEAAADAGRKSAVKRWGGDENPPDDKPPTTRKPKGDPKGKPIGSPNRDPNAKTSDSSSSLRSEEVVVADAGKAAPTSGVIWLQRLTEVRLRFGTCLDASPNANTAKHLQNLCEPHAGVPCDWERDVWPAIETVLGGYVRRGETVSSLGVVCGEAIRNRDRRLAGLPDPEANPQPKTTRGSHGGRRNTGSRIGAAMQLVDEIDRRERADLAGHGEEGEGDHRRIADGRKQS